MQTADVTKRAEHAYSPAIILAPQWWVGLLLALLAGTACTARVHSTVPPTERLECSAAEAPIIVEYDKWRVPVWQCGPRPCPPDREAVWLSGTRPECRVPCESGRPRREGGSCPGQYSLDEKLAGDVVTVIATVDGRPVSGVKVTVANDNNRRTPLMHKTTDAAGVARFNLANEPLHSVLESFVDFQVKNHTLLKDLELTANFRDGSTADCTVSVHDSTSVRQLRARAEEASRAARQDKWSEALQKCTQGDAQTCFDVAVAISSRSDAGSRAEADGYMQRACDLRLQIACDYLADKRREAEQKRKCDEGDGASCNAAGYFRRGCALGFEPACETLRTYPNSGKRHEQDPERAPVPAASGTAEARAQAREGCEARCFDADGANPCVKQGGDRGSLRICFARENACKHACQESACAADWESEQCKHSQAEAWRNAR